MKCPFEILTNKRFLKFGLISLTVFLCVIYFFMPYYTMWQIRTAADERNSRKLSGYVDFLELRQNLKVQLRSDAGRIFRERLGGDEENSMIGMFLTGFMGDQAVELFVTPEGLERLLQGGGSLNFKKQEPNPSASVTPTSSVNAVPLVMEKNKNPSFSWNSLGQFAFDTGVDNKESITLVLSRRGLFTWKVTNVLLSTE